MIDVFYMNPHYEAGLDSVRDLLATRMIGFICTQLTFGFFFFHIFYIFLFVIVLNIVLITVDFLNAFEKQKVQI